MTSSSHYNLEHFIDAERFIPQYKQNQWDTIPSCLLTVGYPYLIQPNHGSSAVPSSIPDASPNIVTDSGGNNLRRDEFQRKWIRDPITRRSCFDMCTFNCIQFLPDFIEYMLRCHDTAFMPCFGHRIFNYKNQIQSVQQWIIQNQNYFKRLREDLDMATSKGQDRTAVVLREEKTEGESDYIQRNRVLQITPEVLAKLCDEIQSAAQSISEKGVCTGFQTVTRLHDQLDKACMDYIQKMHVLMDIERLQAMEDIKTYDIYSCQFDAIEIPPPRKPQASCSGCRREKVYRSSLCVYHYNLSLSNCYNGKEESLFLLENMYGARKPSILKSKRQFERFERNIHKMRIEEEGHNYCIIGHLRVNGIAENRPLVVIGDLIRLRFGSEEVIGEVRSVITKTESIAIILPIPDIKQTGNYFTALKNPRNKPRRKGEDCVSNARFDARFGLFSMKAHDIFRQTTKNIFLSNKKQITRILAPTNLLDEVQKKSQRRLHVGIGEWINPLNAEQKHAVFDIVRKNHGEAPYIIYGPPGTGKTMTVCESIYQILRHDESSKILVCAPSDAACDVITKRLLHMLPKTKNIVRVHWWSRSIDSIPPVLLSCSPINDSGAFIIPPKEELMDACVVVCQCFVAGCLHTGGNSENNWLQRHFTHAFIDESSQSFEFESLIPLINVGTQCSIILSGDPKQLGPTTRSTFAARHGLCMSLQERLMGLAMYSENSNFAVITKLLDNYRSHSALLQIPSELFYAGSLRCKATSELTSLCKNFELLRDGQKFPLMAYDVNGIERSKIDTPSFFNIEECKAIVKIIKALLASPNVQIHAGQIAVITCFRAQVLRLRNILREENLPSINVGVVEDFQGQETSVVLISTVLTRDHQRWKSASKGGLGFMTDQRKFNVAITRASALCIIVGKVEFLESSGSYWTTLVEHIRRNNGINGDYVQNDETYDGDLEDYGIDLLISRVAELKLLGAGQEIDRYQLAMRGYYDDAPEWKVCL